MLRTFLWYLTIVIELIISLPCLLIAKLFPGKGKWPQYIANTFIPPVCLVAGFKADVKGLDKLTDEPALYVGNHQGLFDMILCLHFMGPIKPFLAKIEASKIPVINAWMKMMDCIFIDRGNIRESVKTFEKIEAHLASGKSIIVFPEGTRSRKHEMGEFKAGAFKAAIKSGVPVIPFAINGSYKAWEEKHRICPAKVTLTILDPIDSNGLSTKQLSDKAYNEIKKALG